MYMFSGWLLDESDNALARRMLQENCGGNEHTLLFELLENMGELAWVHC
jgi:hypothetical protein